VRRDAERNRARLIDAAEVLLTRSPTLVTMGEVAREAGLSPATAYRYFPSIEDLLDAFLQEVVTGLRDFSHDCAARGHRLHHEVVDEWIRLIRVHGAGMIQTRSRRGYLSRLHEQDPVIVAAREAWERPIRVIMRLENIPDDRFEVALFLHNILFDPREIVDLLHSGMEVDEVNTHLSNAFSGALTSWSAGG
jgi:AcrR family transcriptional regulator